MALDFTISENSKSAANWRLTFTESISFCKSVYIGKGAAVAAP